ncbi:DUF2958 domain-containing protein [Mesorhizobium shangrilense]|uniref:DUF2958 domain-containing protein n=1 Tax=Mesorhizobium shangrilense TaxID=460060 RepID=UPI003F49AD30
MSCSAEIDFEPIAKLFTPDAGATWLLTELDPDDPDIACGLCDLGMGSPELGYVYLSELPLVREKLLPIASTSAKGPSRDSNRRACPR